MCPQSNTRRTARHAHITNMPAIRNAAMIFAVNALPAKSRNKVSSSFAKWNDSISLLWMPCTARAVNPLDNLDLPRCRMTYVWVGVTQGKTACRTTVLKDMLNPCANTSKACLQSLSFLLHHTATFSHIASIARGDIKLATSLTKSTGTSLSTTERPCFSAYAACADGH